MTDSPMQVPPRVSTLRRQQTARIVLSVALLALGLYTLEGFLRALAWAGVLAIATWPLYARVERRLGGGRHNIVVPLLFTLGAVLLIAVPLALVALQAAHEASTVVAMVNEARDHGAARPDWLAHLPLGAQQASTWWDANLARPEDAQTLLGRVEHVGWMDISRNVGGRVLHQAVILVFTLVTLFFLFREGPSIGGKLLAAADRMFGPAGERVARQMIASIHGTVDGMVLVGLGVGAILGIGYWLAGVPHPALLGGLTALAAVIPMGAPLVLGAASLIVLAQSHTVAAIALFGVGMAIIFVADHAVRPVLIGGATKLPFLWVLLGILGGVETFGLLGLFLGPAIMAALILLWREWTAEVPPVHA